MLSFKQTDRQTHNSKINPPPPQCTDNDWLDMGSLSNDKFLDWSKKQSIGRRQNKCKLKTEILIGVGRKHCGKRRKCWLPAFSPLPTMFQKASFSGWFKVGIVW